VHNFFADNHRSRFSFYVSVTRQRELKYGSLRFIGARPQAPAVRFNDRTADRQAHPQAAGLRGVKGLEQPKDGGKDRLRLLRFRSVGGGGTCLLSSATARATQLAQLGLALRNRFRMR
jgi:hypothetical protein